MAYGLSTRLFVENGPELTARQAQQRTSAAAHQLVWEKLSRDRRLQAVEHALHHAA